MDASRLRSLQPFALSLSGPQLVEASAGTGKTYTIGSLVLRLILEPRPDRVEPPSIDQILVVTFTHAATGELRGRIRERLSEALSQVQGDATCDDVEFSDWLAALAERDPVGCRDRLRAALRDFDDAAIYTIHGFCQRMLQEYAFESGVDFDASLVGDESELRRTAIQDYWANQTYAAPALAVAWLQGPGKLSLDAMEGLGQVLAGAPLIERRPPREAVAGPDAAALARLEEAARSAWAEAARAWRQGGPEALEQLARAANAKDLNGGTYKAATILGPWRQQLERSFAAPPMHPDADLTRLLNKLAAGRMRVNQHRSEPEHPFFDACAELVATRESIESSLTDWGMALRHGLDAWLARELPERKRRARQQSFDDLLWKLHQALQGSASGAASEQAARLRGRIRSRFRAALIDEFQDTDRIQYQIFQGIFAPELGQGAETADAPPLLLVGDPKQAIYAFRGADIFAYLDAVEQVGEGHRHTLGVNYRSDRSLVEALNRVWRATPRPFLFGQIPFSPVQAQHVDRVTPAEPPLRLAYIPAGVANRDGQARLVGAPAARSASARAAATAIGRLLSEPPTVTRAGAGSSAVTAGDIAVLVRTNAQARLMQRVLRAHQIPCVLFSDASVLEQPEAEELRQILAAIIDPSRARRVRAALVTPALGLSGHAIDALAQDERGWEAWIDDLRRWQDSWRRSGILPALRQLMDEQGVAERLLQLGDGERRLTNLLHLAELLHAVAFQQDLGPEGLLAWFDRARQDEAQLRASLGDTAQLRLESDDAAVKLVTVHKAKGLEYPFVFCPFLWSVTRGAGKGPTRYHALDGGGQQYLDIGPTPSEAGRVAAELEGLAEDLRLLYVAMTRARHGLWLCWGPFFGFEQSALAYLLHAGALDGSAPPGTDQAALVAWRDAVVAEAKAARDRAISAESAAEDPLWRPARDLAAGQAGGIAAERVGDADIRAHGALARPDPPGPGPLRALVARRKPRQRLDRSSFTALARGAFEASAASLADGQDHDRLIDADLGPGAGASAGTALDPTAEAAERVPLADLVAGTRLGTGMHLLLERIDFRGDPMGWRQQAEQLARRRALPAEAVEPLLGSLNTLVQTPLGHGALDFRLADLSRRDRIDEMGYVLPVALEAAAGRFVPPGAAGGAPRDRRTAPGSAAFPRVGPADLARVLAAHPGGGLPEDYPRQLERLPAQAIAGWLRGSLDLVFRRPGPQGAACWYLIDWKSNRLGRHWSDYAPERLAQAMAQHHYFLQAHLYTLALHRHLARHAGYDYATGFGGFLYVFVRGMHPDRPGSGVLFDRPPLARIEALDALLREGRR